MKTNRAGTCGEVYNPLAQNNKIGLNFFLLGVG